MPPLGPQARNLTLTEELEKLEQSITLTLQEIDHNFSRAHRIVTTSILPIVEQYAEHSRAVWEGSKVPPLSLIDHLSKLTAQPQFWKQFFESSANVALSSYAELAADAGDGEQETETEDATHDSTTAEHEEDDAYGDRSRPASGGEHSEATEHTYTATEGDSLLDSPSLSGSHSTPRATSRSSAKQSAATTGTPPATYADYPSPYEALKRDLNLSPSSMPQIAPATPPRINQRDRRLPDMSMQSPPFAPNQGNKPSTTDPNATNVLLHRVLDKNYRLQATPIKQTPRSTNKAKAKSTLPHFSSSPFDSSPEAPQLHSEIFSSPIRPVLSSRTRGGPKTPLQKREDYTSTTKYQKGGEEITWDSDDEDDDSGLPLGLSPPKTIQFAVPQSRLLQTPAREASKRIVEDLLLTAGANDTEDLDLDLDLDSPSMVKRHNEELDLSF
ncbi:MAG: DASH complex subunit ask1 [Geoglossum simile]|nr:MAG: DASH complex subunit ask1 [Geoglossum simile]